MQVIAWSRISISTDGKNGNFNVDCMHAGGMADSVVEINDKERNQIQNQILLKILDQLKEN